MLLVRLFFAALVLAASSSAAAQEEQPVEHHLKHEHAHLHNSTDQNANATAIAAVAAAAAAAPSPEDELLQAERKLAKTREYTSSLAMRLRDIHEKHFPKSKRLEGMTQPEFVAAATAMMDALSKDSLYTAGVSSRPGAVKPQYNWPWTRNYRLTDEYYLHMGWRRANKTLWNETKRNQEVGTSDWGHRRPHILGEWSDVPEGCAQGQPGFMWTKTYYLPQYIDPDGNDMYLCKGTPPAGTTLPELPKTRHKVTVCIHKVLNIDSLHIRMRPEWLEAFFQHYAGVGVDHFYVYVSRIPFVDIPGYSYDWIDATWMHAFSDNEYGQIWAMDDCLWRNREQGNGWVLFVDLDELVTLPGVPGGFKGLVSRLEEEKYESANFHSVGYLSNYCDAEYDGEAYGAAPAAVVPAAAGAGGGGRRRRGLAERMVFRAVFPEGCDDIFQHNCSFNNVLAAGGRRKSFVKAESGSTIEIHSLSHLDDKERELFLLTRPGVKKGDFKLAMRAMNGTRAWIKHVRGVGFEDVTAPARTRLLCSGPPDDCDHIPGGLQCHRGVGEVSAVNPSNTWFDERPYELRARAMGDVFDVGYDTDNWGGAIRRRRALGRRRRR